MLTDQHLVLFLRFFEYLFLVDLFVYYFHKRFGKSSIVHWYYSKFWIKTRRQVTTRKDTTCGESNWFIVGYEKDDLCYYRGGILGTYSAALGVIELHKSSEGVIAIRKINPSFIGIAFYMFVSPSTFLAGVLTALIFTVPFLLIRTFSLSYIKSTYIEIDS